MENIFRRSGIDVPEPVRRFLQGETDSWLRTEEYRDENTLVVRTDIPGVDPESDIDVSVTEDTLQITARRREHGHSCRSSPEHRPRKSTLAAGATSHRMHPRTT